MTTQSLNTLITTILVTVVPLLSAKAQQPVLVQNQDTTYFMESPMLDDIVVTAKRYPNLTSLDDLITDSELNTSVSGLTRDLQRDLPSMIRLYTPQGIPMLTKYTSNNSLTSTIPDSAIGLEVREPGAKFPNPDAPVIMQPNYLRRGSITVSPLTQTAIISSGKQQSVAGNVALSHSGTSTMLENLIPEMKVYNTTYSGYGGLHLDFSESQTEIIFHFADSGNEYGELLGVKEFEESDRSANLFVHSQYELGNKTLHAGFARQDGREYQKVKEATNAYEVINEINATSLTTALTGNTTELRANFHDFQRIYTWGPEDSVQIQQFEAVFTHRSDFLQVAKLTTEARFDFTDLEPSLSGDLQIHPHSKFTVNLNAAHLYDAVGSEGLNNLMRSVQIAPHPWKTTYVRLGTDFSHESTSFSGSITHKKVRRGWYGETAHTHGWISRLGAKGVLYKNQGYVQWNVEGVIRTMTLDISEQPSQVMPGPAGLEAHASLESGFGNMKYSIQTDLFIDRQMRITKDVTGNLGSQFFLSMDVSRKINFMELGATLSNGLALLGKENNIVAHHSETSGISYVSAPPVINLNLGIDFY